MIIASTSGRLFIMILGTKQAREHVTGDVATTWLATWQIRVITGINEENTKGWKHTWPCTWPWIGTGN